MRTHINPSNFMMNRVLSNTGLLWSLAKRKPKFLARLVMGGINAVVLRQNQLRFMDVAVDYDCNMQCSHCSAVNMGRGRKQNERLTLKDYTLLADQLCIEGCLIFHFTGGEPLLRNDLEDIIEVFKPNRCGISIQSNGILASRTRLKSCREAGADIFCVRACLKTRKHCAISTRQAQKRDKRSLKKIWQVYHNELQPA